MFEDRGLPGPILSKRLIGAFSMHKPFKGVVPANSPYLSNKYTLWYYGIIDLARQRTRLLEFVERHHIIPDCFFSKRKRKGSPGWLPGDPNVSANLAMLTPREHFLCHWLLTKMVTGKAKYQMYYALASFCKQNIYQNRQMSSGAYKKIREYNSLSTTGSKIYNNGVVQRRFMYDPGNEWTLGALESSKNRNIGSKMYNNGLVAIRRQIHPGEGWTPGSLNGTIGLKWWHSGEKSVMSRSQPGPEWRRGLPRISKLKNGAKWWNDGQKEVQSVTCPGDDWKLGMLTGSKGKKWYNDGINNKMFNEHPGIGWEPGMLPKSQDKITVR